MRSVRGVIELPSAIEPNPLAQIYVRVEDVSRADAPARLLGQTVLRNLQPSDFLQGSLPFELSVADPPEGARCTVRVHLDVDGSGSINAGDYVSTEHIPVLEARTPSEVRVTLRRVG